MHSLRELERLARLDLGCMWVTGSIAPDHADIGRFIVLHEESLTAACALNRAWIASAVVGCKR